MLKYRYVKNIRFSCAYLFRICINNKYFLVKDEQGRNTFQPVGGVYKYTDDSILEKTNAFQCMRFGTNSDLDCDLRIIVPRNKVGKFKRWYKSEKGRETQENLYREFQEEIIDRIDGVDPALFGEIKYRCCGSHIEVQRMGENDLQIRMADIVELIPTPKQTKFFCDLMLHENSVYCFATKEDIYALGRTGGNQVQTISGHSYKILAEEEKFLKKNKHTGKYYTARPNVLDVPAEETWPLIDKADISKEFTFVSYNSLNGKSVWDFCCDNTPPLSNLWIDRKSVGENWTEDVKRALCSQKCKKAILFVNKAYILQSTACYEEVKMILESGIPHIVVLIDIDSSFVVNTIDRWIHNDAADKNKLRVFKDLFHYDDDTGHANVSMFCLNKHSSDRILQSYSNL